MKLVLILTSLFLGLSPAFAGSACKTSDGDSVNVYSEFVRGLGVSVRSQKVADYYKKNLQIEIGKLESVVDPETNKYATEDSENGHLFAVGLEPMEDESQVGNIWSLDFQYKTGNQATAVLTDMQGVQFHFDLQCEQTPDLE